MRFDPAFAYRMPVAFGPMPGPRQVLPGCGPQASEATLRTFCLRFRSTAAALLDLLPPGFSIDGAPMVIVEYTELADVAWLAGRGYHTFAVKLPVWFEGRRDRVRGAFVTVVWESKADPIITGRDELGYAKLFADLESGPEGDGTHKCTASWEGHVFAELEFRQISPLVATSAVEPQTGTLNYRYVPGVERHQGPEAMGVVLTPPAPGVVLERLSAEGGLRFVRSTWTQLPTFYNVINALERLPMLGVEGCELRRLRRNIENRGQRRLA